MTIDLKTRNLDDICGQMEKLLFKVETISKTNRRLLYVIIFLSIALIGSLCYLIFS
jgi:hypothetical protein